MFKKKKKRKIVEINTVYEKKVFTTNVFALCDDGTLWVKSKREGEAQKPWIRIKDVPQED